MIFECPGSQRFKQPYPEVIKCPSCSVEMEIWSDEVHATCPECEAPVSRNKGQSCLEWCRQARICCNKI